MNRAEFMSMVHPFCTEREAQNVELAYLFAKKVHKGQVRKAEFDDRGNNLRYFEHPRRVATILIKEAGVVDPDLVICALLHDVIEDADEVKLTSAMVERLFGNEVAFIVRLVTKLPKESYIARLEAAIPSTEGRAMLVKAADRLDNLRHLPEIPKRDPEWEKAAGQELVAISNHKRETASNFCEKQRKETRDVLLPLFTKADSVLPEVLLPGFRRIVGQIREKI